MSRLWYYFCRRLCRLFVLSLFRFRWSGSEHVPPSGPVLLVSNHQSHLDPVLVGVACPRQIKALARQGLFFWPMGWLLRSVGAVPLDRQRGSIAGLKATLRLLRDDHVVLVFPEGTRTVDGSLGPLLPGFCALARRGGAAVVPVAIDGAFAAMPRGRLMPRLRPIRLTFGPPIRPDDLERLSDDELVELARSRIAGCVGHGFDVLSRRPPLGGLSEADDGLNRRADPSPGRPVTR